MILNKKLNRFIFILAFVILYVGCKNENHIDKYEVNLDSLKTLPDGFYALRRGRIYYAGEQYMIWVNLKNSGDVKSIFKITDYADSNADEITIISKYGIDTTEKKFQIQKFIELSHMYKFGHIDIEKSNKISFSYQDGLSEQYIKTFNDSLKNIYLDNKDFRLLSNGWFEYIE